MAIGPKLINLLSDGGKQALFANVFAPSLTVPITSQYWTTDDTVSPHPPKQPKPFEDVKATSLSAPKNPCPHRHCPCQLSSTATNAPSQSIPITLYHQLKCGLPSGFPNSICPSTSSQRAHGKPAKSKPFARSSIMRHNASRGDFTQTSQPQPSGTGQRSLTETHHSEPSGFFALDRRAAAT